MLLSLSDRYLFLSNPKAASTSFETTYGNRCEIASCQGNRFGRHPVIGGGGKHANYRESQRVFAKLFANFMPLGQTFVFGTVREPLSRLASYYRFFTRNQGARDKVSIGDMSFEQLVRNLINRPQGGLARNLPSQYDFFRDETGEISLNYLIKLDNMVESLATIDREVGLDFSDVLGTSVNVSDERAFELADPGLRRAFDEYFAKDIELFETKTDRLLKPVEPGRAVDIDAALRWMATRGARFDLASSIIYKMAQRIANDPGFKVSDVLALIDRPAASQ